MREVGNLTMEAGSIAVHYKNVVGIDVAVNDVVVV